MRRALIAAVLLLLAFPLPARASVPTVAEELAGYLSDVPSATQYRYGLRDNLGNPMTALKVVPNPQGGYVGVYHSFVGGDTQFIVRLAVSEDLVNWTHVRDLASNSLAPTVNRLWLPNDQSWVVAYQTSTGCSGAGGSSGYCLRFLRYTDINSLLGGSPLQSFTAPRTLSDCAEGTPNLTIPSIDAQGKLVLDFGFHYKRDCLVRRQATGTLVDFSSWSAEVDTNMNALFESATPTVRGSVRDRDVGGFRGRSFNIHEAELARSDQSTWRAWLYQWQTNALSILNVRTHGGSLSFGNPRMTNVQNADGSGRLIVTYQVFPEGAAPGEAGELLFYRDYDPTIVAAGDISSPSFAGQQRTAALIAANPATKVLTLGDNQYETGTLTNFNKYYGATWGQFKSSTYPSPGNHDSCPSSGYDEYFGRPCWYSVDVGKWHLISLNSMVASDAAQLAFLDQDLASTTKQCVAAYWHHPRFSSGPHGNSQRTAPFWTRLYNANADVVLVGHDHTYERFAPQTPTAVRDDARGIRQFIVGTGGRSLYSFNTIRANSEVRYNGGLGVLRMKLRPTGYDWRFESEAGKTFTDEGSAECH